MSTKIADIIVPEVFNPYVIKRTTELDAFVNSGIITNNPELDALASKGGKLINMPYFDDLGGEDEVLTDSGALTPDKIIAGQDVATLFMRGKAWSVNDLAEALSGDDPMGAIGSLVGGFWSRRRQSLLFSMLKGVFNSINSNKLDISAKAAGLCEIGGKTFLDALQTLGDARYKIVAVGMHSATMTSLNKLDLIDTIKASDGVTDLNYFMGKRVIEDDGCPVNGDVYTTYLFGNGAIGLGNGKAPVPTETDRDSLAGEDILVNRQHFVLHPRGIKFTASSVAGSSPTNGEVELAANWSRVYDTKDIRMIQFTHKITL